MKATVWCSMTMRCGCYFRPALVVPPDVPISPGYRRECTRHGKQEVIRVTLRLFDAPGENNPGQTR